ncbi:MAG: SMP-30/gluconolactonase/LRE family protein [Candidatus Faecalibacterium intestinavium]|uniref:SMP-30/gluconolactonase/LRE family protein n=1 Tax=Candidatus Faecalibacterium intestinavium TaxID=2838580 RepID=A0A9E2KL04_9FIRM|nr:SMP-30/gluconolactonase/LRE family protein [Candidatus Faecalibacterium intestinavium]
MRLGLIELILVVAIAALVLGPSVVFWVLRWMHRAEIANRAAARRRAEIQAQIRAERDAVLHRFQIVGFALAVLMVLSLLYALLLRPIDPRPQSYSAPAVRTEEAARSAADTEERLLDGFSDPACVRVREGWVYLAVRSEDTGGSAILRMREDGSSLSKIVELEGEITDFDFDPEGEIWLTLLTRSGGMLCRASYDGWGASTEQVVTQIDGQPLPCPAAVAVGADGRVYFANLSRAEAENGLDAALRTELLAHTATGQVYVYDPAARTVETVVSGLAGASGLAYLPEENALYISELGQRCVWKVDADVRDRTAGGRGSVLFAGELPGYPAALALDEDGDVWIGYRWNRSSWLEAQSAEEFQRGVALRLPGRMQQGIFGTGEGTPAADCYTAEGVLALTALAADGQGTTALAPTGSRLYLGTSGSPAALRWLLY